jgi:hypothetical protein
MKENHMPLKATIKTITIKLEGGETMNIELVDTAPNTILIIREETHTIIIKINITSTVTENENIIKLTMVFITLQRMTADQMMKKKRPATLKKGMINWRMKIWKNPSLRRRKSL